MEFLLQFADFFIHIDKHLTEIVSNYGWWTYAILFLIIFCETGLVVAPLLPGDSLLFAAGAIAARGNLDVVNLIILLIIAAILGDALNYRIGSWFGPRVFQERYSRIFKPSYLNKTQGFYDRYGGKTIIIARFMPIVRTFAPFLAGVGAMNYAKFTTYNIIGGILWVILFVSAGYMFSELDIVKNNFSLVILAIIIISIMPAVFEIVRAKIAARKELA